MNETDLTRGRYSFFEYLRNVNNITLACDDKCHSNCGANFYKFYSKKKKIINSTKLNLIPITSNHLRFVETFKSDFNYLIYNIGGVMSLWFGLYPLSFVQFFSFCNKTFKRIQWKQLFKSLKYYLYLKIIIMITLFDLFILSSTDKESKIRRRKKKETYYSY